MEKRRIAKEDHVIAGKLYSERKIVGIVFPGGTCRKESIRGITKREAVDEITQPAFYTGCPKAWAAF